MNFADWNRGLLVGELLVVVAGMALVSGRTGRDRLLAAGILSQGIVMILVAGGAYFPRAGFSVASVALLIVYGVWLIWLAPGRSMLERTPTSPADTRTDDGDATAGGAAGDAP